MKTPAALGDSGRRQWLRVTSRTLGVAAWSGVGGLGGLGGLGGFSGWGGLGAAAGLGMLGPKAQAAVPTNTWQGALAAFAQGATLQAARVSLLIDAVVENGHTVPVTVSYSGPADGARVQALAVMTERNPAPEVVEFSLSAMALPRVHTRLRLATSQGVWAAARLTDGSCWVQRVDVLVTLAACVEEL